MKRPAYTTRSPRSSAGRAEDGAHPGASVVGASETVERREVVELSNPSDVGLSSATIDVDYGGTTRRLEFRHVPADGERRGTVTCPAGSAGSDPSASVTSWIEV
ncbi:hypothetical protein ACFQE1_16720 [Halobium palmae]|uniref:Uncharacterized protein n=1 Tax=Halobium palmae TaxID=1776492 RepID=A0ABD5S4L8_9EURY